MATKSDREEGSSSGGEVTAEWIVKAQLKITQPKKKAASFGTGDCGAKRATGSPCRVVYKWNSDGKSQESGSNKPTQESNGNNDSMCKSTCSIILTTDMCPAAMIEKSKNKDGCTTHTYTFSPDQTKIVHDCTKHPSNLSVSKDASCQTSDCEATPERRSPSTEGRRRYDHRRATESLVSSRSRSEGRLLTPSRTPRQPSPALSNNSPRSSKDKKKPPRTVHIDVYCTGSEHDTNSDSSSPNIVDDFANLMAQATVIETEDMLLRHQRVVDKGQLPRKMTLEKQPKIDEPDDELFDFSRVIMQNNANEKEEVNESKQMLFKKYLGDQRQIRKFNELRSLMTFRRDISDDAISSNYANSNYSTVRDLTTSSIGSGVPTSPFEDSESTWKELDGDIKARNFITPVGGSFQQWDKGEEMQKMKQFERLWNRDEDPARDLLSQSKLMENFMFVNRNRGDSENSGNVSESDPNMQMGNFSDSSPPTVVSFSNRRKKQKSPEKTVEEVRSMSSSLRSGTYSKDHLALSRRFGSVIKTMRKPGHHVGPVRNPTCLCETCKRWMLERDQVQSRDRAFSFGDTPIMKTSFWKRNNRNFV